MKKNSEKEAKIMLPAPLGQVRNCPIITDPQGCYTGKPIEKLETPVQDADDL